MAVRTSLGWLLGVCLSLCGAWNVQAQCVPDSSVNQLYAPDLNQGLPDGEVTVAYEAVITLNVPTDTTYLSLSAQIDSMTLENVTGLPPGFTYECVPASCGFPAGEYSCIKISGLTSDNAHAVTWDIEAEFLFYIKQPAITLPYTLEGYSIKMDSVAVGLKEHADSDYRFMLEPNPITDASKLVFDLPSVNRYTLDVYSLLGSNVVHREAPGKRSGNTFPLGDFATDPGVYFITINQGNYSRSMRFIVQ